jgi:diadenosine tetraphosphate (Ap4A) HIT family hydrolase
MSVFLLAAPLAGDTIFVADWALSQVLLMNDVRYPWLILVPRKAGLVELDDLAAGDRATLMEEIARAGQVLKKISRAAKINVGALGNIVPQLHVHIVARGPGDEAWPGPVWGQGERVPYEPDASQALLNQLRQEFNG